MRLKVAPVPAVVALIIAAPALALSNGGGNSADAPGQANAKENCHQAYVGQNARGVQAGGGPKAAETGPLNCDHYWQDNGSIGNGP
jgi:hypothetical protein